MWAESARGTVIVDPEAWAFRVTYRLAMDHHRLGRMVRSLTDRLSSVEEREDLDPADRVAVWAAVDKLPPRQRAVIYLRYRADLSYDRIATVMGITANGARNDASAATATLRKRYASEEGSTMTGPFETLERSLRDGPPDEAGYRPAPLGASRRSRTATAVGSCPSGASCGFRRRGVLGRPRPGRWPRPLWS